ncbi:MAG: hypothetical protein ACPGF7_12235 [Pontibacterium sp.]
MQYIKFWRHLRLSRAAIISPVIDLLCIGGGSLLVMGLILSVLLWCYATGSYARGSIDFIDLFILQTLINWPHFVVSYKLLYGRKENLSTYPMATLYVPAGLLLICLAALFYEVSDQAPEFTVNQQMAYYFWLVAALYLAWHYTGQAWGMVATFAHLSGLKLLARERCWLRGSLHTLIFWHVIWGASDMPKYGLIRFLQTDEMMTFANTVAVMAFVSGLYTFAGIIKRHGAIDARVFVPWLAVFVWYLVLFLEPGAYMFVQLSHALQYLIFPARVELNRLQEKQPEKQSLDFTAVLMSKILAYYLVIVAVGLMIFYLPDLLIGNTGGLMTIGGMLALAVNIHHYYTDSAIWKLRDKTVRQQLFSHLPGAVK